MEVTLDDEYQMTIDEYLYEHDMSINELMFKEETDVQLLLQAKKKLLKHGHENMTDKDMYVFQVINEKINKKRKHLERLHKWNSKKETNTKAG